MFWKKKKNQPDILVLLRQFQLGAGEESTTGTKADLQLVFEEC